MTNFIKSMSHGVNSVSVLFVCTNDKEYGLAEPFRQILCLPIILQVLIKNFTVGVNPCETYARSGHFGVDKLPFIPGTDCSGVVVRAGINVTKVKVNGLDENSQSLSIVILPR